MLFHINREKNMERKQISIGYLREIFLFLALTGASYKIVKDTDVNKNQRETYEKSIEQKEVALQQAEEKVKKYEEDGKKRKEALGNYYPPFRGTDLLDKQDKENLAALLSLTLPLEVANEHIKNNTCSYKAEILGEGLKGSAEYGGCVFLTEDLVLTNYHVVHVDYFRDFFPIKSTVTTSDGLEVLVKELIAISPLYDLALVRLKEPVASVFPTPVGQVQKEVQTFSYVSLYHKTGQEKLSLDEGTLNLIEAVPFSLNLKGGVDPPSLVMQVSQGRELTYGDSGCPILQDGKVVGLFYAHREKRQYVTYAVSAFLSQLISN